MIKVGSMLLSPSKYSTAIPNSPKINHRIRFKIIERVRNIYPSSTLHPLFLAFKGHENIFYLSELSN
jgi:hypothetical protein